MKINKVAFYKTIFILVLLFQMYIPSFKFNVLFQLLLLVLFVLYEKPKIALSFFKITAPIYIVFFLGFLGFLVFNNSITQALKDVFHFIKPLQGLLIGFLFFQIINDKEKFYKTIILTGVLSAIIHLFIVVVFTDFTSGSVHAIRQYTRDNFLELFAVFFLIFYPIYYKKQLFNSELKRKTILLLLLISCFFYFSRTMIVASIILLMSVYGYTKITMKSLKIISVILLFIALLYTYLFSVKIDRNAKGYEAFLYKVKIAPSEIFKTKVDRENHKDLWDHWRGYEANRAIALMDTKPLSYLIGVGHGSLVDLKFKAPLSGEKDGMRYISELHNGYPYVLYKTGIFGLLLYIFFLFTLYYKIHYNSSLETVLISAIGLFYFFTTITITGIYNTQDTIVFILGALLFFTNKRN
ncbi:O-antigen ligase family protein [Flavobacterium sp. UBA6135]|uniref:O-antigen ligase family protein n=1 Tax=Flavobacterium sp. UBA6135 TaxID=1946553 RepID=UPI0025C57A94|nr:O-antigen ligase family protein [Flavobacterium sp. UBA6135]